MRDRTSGMWWWLVCFGTILTPLATPALGATSITLDSEPGDTVDGEGCSLAAFCARFTAKRLSNLADWGNDEPRRAADCAWQREWRPR